jgi:hypothetical protein
MTEKFSKQSINQPWKSLCTFILHQNWTHKKNWKNKFPRTRDAKIKEKVFVGPQIRELIKDVKFKDQLSEMEKKYGNN